MTDGAGMLTCGGCLHAPATLLAAMGRTNADRTPAPGHALRLLCGDCAERTQVICERARRAVTFLAVGAEAGESPDVHTWFGLSYANYTVLPRTLLQSMPEEWQHRFTALMDELDTAFAHVPQARAYKVTAAEVHEAGELTDQQMTAARIRAEERPCDEDHDHGEDEGVNCFTVIGYTDLETGRELDRDERVLVPVPDPLPAYNRGRTRIEPAPREETDRD